MTRHFAHVTATGPGRYGQVPGAIGVLDDASNPMPIGMAFCTGWDPARLGVWRLTIRGADVAGRGSSSIESSGRSKDEGAGAFHPGVRAVRLDRAQPTD